MAAFNHILVACDSSPASLLAFDRAVALAEWCGASLRALHVGTRGAAPRSGGKTRAADLSRLEKLAAKSGVDLEKVARPGRPATAIMDEVARSGTDLVVVGVSPARGR
ncbi:MAG TPA: universal stress protein, partial [Vicinamibacteria bacterium]